MSATPHADRPQTAGEELANSLSHGFGFLLAAASLPVLLSLAPRGAGTFDLIAFSVFSATMMLVYGTSAIYHAAPAGRVKQLLNRCDHAAIFLFIAGTYTPFVLDLFDGGWGWWLLGAVWLLAVLGVTAKLCNRLRNLLWSTLLYVLMGWVAVIAAAPLLARMPHEGLAWVMGGGASYTAGAIVFMFDSRVRYGHFVWHLFVLGGSACHFCAVLGYAR